MRNLRLGFKSILKGRVLIFTGRGRCHCWGLGQFVWRTSVFGVSHYRGEVVDLAVLFGKRVVESVGEVLAHLLGVLDFISGGKRLIYLKTALEG